MIAPPDHWTRVSDPAQLLELSKKYNLTPKTFKSVKPLFYTGAYVGSRTPCQLKGYVDDYALVIEVDGQLHTIHPDALKDMQSVSKALDSFTVLDIETTGLSKADEIIEISAIRVDHGTISDTFDQLIRPMNPVSKEITRLTGITNDMLQGKPLIETVLPEFLKFVKGSVLVGHNIKSFDVPFLNRIAEKNDSSLKNSMIDTLHFSRDCLNLEHYTLEDVANALSVERGTAHRAMGDCETTLRCFQALCKIKNPPRPTKLKKDEEISPEEKQQRKERQAEFLRWKSTPKAKDIVPTTDLFNPAHPLFMLTCVITGDMQNSTKAEAMQRIVDCGGHVGDNVTKKTDILVIGAKSDPNKKSGKLEKAEYYNTSGSNIQILSEEEFMKLLNWTGGEEA